MAVKVRKKGGKWYVFVDWQGKRKAKCVGSNREAAETVRRAIEKRLALGTFSVGEEAETPSFAEYAERWMSSHVRVHLKRSSIESYEGILRFYLVRQFGHLPLDQVTRTLVKSYLAEVVRSAKLARNTIRNVCACLRAILGQEVEDGLLVTNAAVRLGALTGRRPKDASWISSPGKRRNDS